MLMMLLSLLACGEEETLKQKVDTLEQELGQVRGELQQAESDRDMYRARVTALEGEVEGFRRRETYGRLGIEPGADLGVVLRTSLGDVSCELFPDEAPQTVLNFVELAEGKRAWTDPHTGNEVKRPLYSGTIFHRVIPGFMIQGGDPLGNGRGGPGYKFEDEVDSGRVFDQQGLLAMANAGPNTNGSQFFITTSTPSHLNGKHTIFGKCENSEVVARISAVETGAADRPIKDVVLRQVVVVR